MDKKMPFCQILKNMLAEAKDGLTLEELTQVALQKWGRNFPLIAYHPIALVYKLAGTYLPVEFDPSIKAIKIQKEAPAEIRIPLSPQLNFEDLNSVVSELKSVKIKLSE